MSDRFAMFGPKKHRVFTSDDGVDEFAVDLNLTPLMDVMSNILFFLLAGFGAAIVSFLAASVPVQADSDAPAEAPRADKVTVNLQITPDGYRLSATAEKVAPEELMKLRRDLKKTSAGYDTHALTRHLFDVKQGYPASDTVLIVPSAETVYEEIVAAMEAAKDVTHDGLRLRLFPKAVIADLVRAEPADEAK